MNVHSETLSSAVDINNNNNNNNSNNGQVQGDDGEGIGEIGEGMNQEVEVDEEQEQQQELLMKHYRELPRLVPRNLPYDQSKNTMDIHNRITNNIIIHGRSSFGGGGKYKSNVEGSSTAAALKSLLIYNWFHVMLRVNVVTSVGVLLGIWTMIIVIFAMIYMAIDTANIDTDCGLGPPGKPIEFGTAFAFSLETCTTVGYGLPGSTNAFFESGCPSVQAFIYFQMVWSMMFNAFLFAFFFSKLAKSESRGIQVVFTNRAIIKKTKPAPRPKIPRPPSSQPSSQPFSSSSSSSSAAAAAPQKADHTDNDHDNHHHHDDNDDEEDDDGNIELQFRVYDVDCRHPVVEAHIRMYVIMKDGSIYWSNDNNNNNTNHTTTTTNNNNNPTNHHSNGNNHHHLLQTNPNTSTSAFQPKQLRIVCPNDELSSMLFMSLPTVVTHHIDQYSYLSPSSIGNTDEYGYYYSSSSSCRRRRPNKWKHFIPPTRLQLRSLDALTGNRNDYICPICAETYGTYQRLKQHVMYNAYQEKEGGIPNGPLSHQSIHHNFTKDFPPPSKAFPTNTITNIKTFFRNHVAEIFCLVEGIDPLTSGTFQALHSYRYEDIVWGYDNDTHYDIVHQNYQMDIQFEDCVSIATIHNEKKFQVDLNKFHSIITTKRRVGPLPPPPTTTTTTTTTTTKTTTKTKPTRD